LPTATGCSAGPATIDLLDSNEGTGFKNSTLAGLSFAITDLRIPGKKQAIIDAQQKRADRIEKNLSIGAITECANANSALLDNLVPRP